MKAKIYTKTGDQGETSLVGGSRVRKSHPRLETYGTLDELNSFVGVLRAALPDLSSVLPAGERDLISNVDLRLKAVQNGLFDLGSHLACEDDSLRSQLPALKGELVKNLESDMDAWESQLPTLKNFILPGGSHVAAMAHVSRTITRRAERLMVGLNDEADATVTAEEVIFMNRLSDWFFLLSRKLNAVLGRKDLEWEKG